MLSYHNPLLINKRIVFNGTCDTGPWGLSVPWHVLFEVSFYLYVGDLRDSYDDVGQSVFRGNWHEGVQLMNNNNDVQIRPIPMILRYHWDFSIHSPTRSWSWSASAHSLSNLIKSINQSINSLINQLEKGSLKLLKLARIRTNRNCKPPIGFARQSGLDVLNTKPGVPKLRLANGWSLYQYSIDCERLHGKRLGRGWYGEMSLIATVHRSAQHTVGKVKVKFTLTVKVE